MVLEGSMPEMEWQRGSSLMARGLIDQRVEATAVHLNFRLLSCKTVQFKFGTR